ncbi:hypothetical protein FKM82_002325 [Ascaphus truei]
MIPVVFDSRCAPLTVCSLCFLKPACISGISLSIVVLKHCWIIFRRILLKCGIKAMVWKFEQSFVSPFFGIGMNTALFHSFGHSHVLHMRLYKAVNAATDMGLSNSAGMPLIPGGYPLANCFIAHTTSSSIISGSSSSFPFSSVGWF